MSAGQREGTFLLQHGAKQRHDWGGSVAAISVSPQVSADRCTLNIHKAGKPKRTELILCELQLGLIMSAKANAPRKNTKPDPNLGADPRCRSPQTAVLERDAP